MRREAGRFVLLRRTALLLAAALHLLGAAAGPVLHVWASRAPAAESGVRAAEPPQAPRLAHDEVSCAVCRSLGSVALPVADAGATVPAEVRHAPAPAEARLRGSSPPRALNARAPPAFS